MMNKIILATIASILLVVGIVSFDNKSTVIEQINEELSSAPPAAGVGINRDGSRTSSNLGSKSTSGSAGIARRSSTRSVYKVTEGNVTSYSDVPRRVTMPSKSTNTTTTASKIEKKVEIIKVNAGTIPRQTQASATCNIGVNSGGITYYSNEMPLKDLAKMSLGWNSKNVLDLDGNGYLKTVSEGVQTIISDDAWGRRADNNKYILLYDGEGKLAFTFKGAPKVISEKPGRIELELRKGRMGMIEKSTNPANYLRNIRIVPLEHEFDYDKEITTKQFRNTWRGVGVIRYLNAQKTNNSGEVRWQDRQKKTTFGAPKGLSLEDIIQISNETNTNPWILAPHLADDEYFTKMAIYVRDNLKPNLKVYLEYTNEAWNFGFKQAHYLYELSQQNGTSRQLEYGKRAKRLFDIWSDVFGGNKRLVRVIGTQLYYTWITKQIMETPGLAESVDALAVGYYMGNELGGDKMAQKVIGMTDDEVFDYIYNVDFPKANKALTEQKQIADQYNLKLIAYEAGQHLAAGNKWRENVTLVDKFIRLNRSPKMYQLYMDMYQLWNSIGGEMIVWFQTAGNPSKFGNWGILENYLQNYQDAPKYRAVKTILVDNGCL